jgi:hypothetical protein
MEAAGNFPTKLRSVWSQKAVIMVPLWELQISGGRSSTPKTRGSSFLQNVGERRIDCLYVVSQPTKVIVQYQILVIELFTFSLFHLPNTVDDTIL